MSHPSEFSNDRPLTSKTDDRLNRAPFAERIASMLKGLPKGESLIVGIHGPWGDGKTTVLNILKNDLTQSPDIAVVEFNPWRFTDEAAMLGGFFRVLAQTIRAKLSTRGEDIAGWVEKVGRYASVVNDRFGNAANIAAEQAEAGLEELRVRLFGALSASDKRIVVLIDDIDRLDKHETHTLFRLIKACADFPNVCYVLAFDDTAVAKSLGERYGGGDEAAGRAFLEKIIQVPLKLPVAAKEDLRTLLYEQLERALLSAGIEQTREQVGEVIAGLDRGIMVRLTTPRAAKRYGNGLMFALPVLKNETNSVDLLLVEALRAFFPEVYDVVRDNHSEFSGVESDHRGRRDEGPRSIQLLKPVLDAMPKEHAKAVKVLLIDLFPRVSGVLGNVSYSSDWLARWSSERRISSPEYCPRYFAYAIPINDIADSEVTSIVGAAVRGDTSFIETQLAIQLAGPKAGRMIEKFRAIETTIDPKVAETLALIIAKLAKSIPNPQTLFSFARPPAQAAILISHLIHRILDRSERVAAAKRVVEIADPLWFGAECVRWVYVTDKPEQQDSNTLTEDETAVVRRVLVERIKRYAANGAPLFDPDVLQERSLLYEWWRAEGREPVEAHLLRVFKDDPKQVARFLQSQAPLAVGMNDVIPHVGDLDAGQLKNIKVIIDLDKLAALIRELCTGNFENPDRFPDRTKPVEQRLAEQFMLVYNKWKKDGEPPDRTVVNNAEVDTDEAGTDDGDQSEV